MYNAMIHRSMKNALVAVRVPAKGPCNRQSAIDNPELFYAGEKYRLMAPVIDSWMQRDISAPNQGRTVKIKVLNFSPASARQKGQPYPLAVLKLGCSIWKIRNEVYGDAQYGGAPFYNVDDCKGGPGK
jgi:hypothetical protein